MGKYKLYKNKCNDCNYCVESDKKYALVRTMLKHKRETCGKKPRGANNCDQCDYKTNDELMFKRHMRDFHDMNTVSTSPPPKRKRKSAVQSENQSKEAENKESEDMEIDEENKTEEDTSKERSDMNDRNIVPKVIIKEAKEEACNKLKKGLIEEPNKEEKVKNDDQNKLKEALKDKKRIEEDYFKCVNELVLKTEECEKLKIELKDLRQLIQLKSEAQDLELNSTQRIPEKVDDDVPNEIEIKEANENQWKKVLNKNKKRKHSFVKNKPEISEVEEEYNCDEECDFQGTSQDQLEKHIKIKHRITCRICD